MKILVIGSAMFAANVLNILAGSFHFLHNFFDLIDAITFHTCASLNCGNPENKMEEWRNKNI